MARRDLSEIRRELFLKPLMKRNSGAHPVPDPEENGGDPGAGPPADAPNPSDTMLLPKPPRQQESASQP